MIAISYKFLYQRKNMKKLLITIPALLISIVSFADDVRVEFCPGTKTTLANGTERKLENYNLGEIKHGGHKLVCRNDGKSFLYIDYRYTEYVIDTYQTCEKIQRSMDANPKNSYTFLYDKYEYSVIAVSIEPNRICDERGVIRNKQGTRLDL